MIKTIVVDDEWYNLEEICDLVEKTGFMSVDGRYQNGEAALKEVAAFHRRQHLLILKCPKWMG